MAFLKLTIPFILFSLFSFAGFSQDKSPVKFGKVSPADFTIKSSVVDSSTEAVVIADIGRSEFLGNTKSRFSIVFTRKTRIKILKNQGMDAATVEIPLYINSDGEEKVKDLKASTFNLENGKVVEVELNKESVFKDKLTKNIMVTKFTMPAVKPGSIIEYSYSIHSDFIFNLQPWEFQGEYPRLWSEYQVEIPEYFQYVFLSQGFKEFTSSNRINRMGKWEIIQTTGGKEHTRLLEGQININTWVVENLSALKEEPYTSTIDNHVCKIQFQLAKVEFPNQNAQQIMSTWEKAMTSLMDDDDFGSALKQNNNWLDDELKIITAGSTTSADKAKKIYQHVKNNYTSTGRTGLFLTDNLKTVYKNKRGSVAELNLLLVAMLLHEKIKAYPLILSTKSHGFTNELYPILEKFNYVVCFAEIDGNEILLDASIPALAFGQLHWKCYNGHSRLVDPVNPSPIILNADSLHERKVTIIHVGNDEKNQWGGKSSTTFGPFESMDVKAQVADKGEEDFFKQIRSAFTYDIDIHHTGIDSLRKNGEPVVVNYAFTIPVNTDEDLLYFNPLMGNEYHTNPFSSADRIYPVEMPFAINEAIYVNLTAPKGYMIDEFPKSAKINFNEDEGFFEYRFQKVSDDGLQIRSWLKLDRANFDPEEYDVLREFYALVVKKQAELVVFKKRK
jgi:hypothetical protein